MFRGYTSVAQFTWRRRLISGFEPLFNDPVTCGEGHIACYLTLWKALGSLQCGTLCLSILCIIYDMLYTMHYIWNRRASPRECPELQLQARGFLELKWPRARRAGGLTKNNSYIPPNVPLLRAFWSLLDGIWGVLKGSWGCWIVTLVTTCTIVTATELLCDKYDSCGYLETPM